MWESAAKPEDALGKERGSLGDREVMRFMADDKAAREPHRLPPHPGPIVLGLALPPLLPLREPLVTLCGAGAGRGNGAVLAGTGVCHHWAVWGGGSAGL